MPIIPVGEWIPDASALGNPGSIVIRNAVPGPNSYQPFRAHTPVTVELDSRPLGGISVRDKANNVFNYVGSQEALYVQSGRPGRTYRGMAGTPPWTVKRGSSSNGRTEF